MQTLSMFVSIIWKLNSLLFGALVLLGLICIWFTMFVSLIIGLLQAIRKKDE